MRMKSDELVTRRACSELLENCLITDGRSPKQPAEPTHSGRARTCLSERLCQGHEW